MFWNALFYVKLNKFGPLDHQIFFYDETKNVLVVEIILLLEDIQEWFYNVIDIGSYVADTNGERNL